MINTLIIWVIVKKIGVVFIDLCKAFNTIDHNILPNKKDMVLINILYNGLNPTYPKEDN